MTRFAHLFVLSLILLAPTEAYAEVDQDGNEHVWKGATGSYRVIDFAAAWCAPCWKALPRVQDLARRTLDVEFLVVSVDEEIAGRDRLVEKLKLTLPVVWDENHAIARHYEPEAFPATYVIDPDGTIVYAHFGFSEEKWKDLERFVSALPHERD